MSDRLADAVEASLVNTAQAVLSAECLAGACELCPGSVEDGHRNPPLTVVPCACTEARHHQAARHYRPPPGAGTGVDQDELRRLPPVGRKRERKPEPPFNQRPAIAGLGEAPDWRGYPPGHKEGEGVNADQPETVGPGSDGRPEPPKAGDLLIDRRAGRPGRVVRLLDEYIRLRPLLDGLPWIAPLPAVRHATDEVRRAAVLRTRVLIWREAAR